MYEEYELNVDGVDPAEKHSPAFLKTLVDGTAAIPGSSEKVMVLMARYASGLPLWNKNDARQFINEEATAHRGAAPFAWLIMSEPDELSEAPEDPLPD